MAPTTLVTGANSYTGRNLCRFLAERGVSTRGMYWPPDGIPDSTHENLQLVPGDLRDRDSLKRALEGIKVVHNLAALYRATNVPNRAFWEVNVSGVGNIVELAGEAGVKRFVQCSTVGVYGHVENPPANERSPVKPDDYYQYTKLKGEELALELAQSSGLAMTVARPAGIYGPYEDRFLHLPRLIQRRRFVMFGSGENLYHFIHIGDLCEALVLCAERPEAIGQTYIIADDCPISLNAVVSIISDELGFPKPTLRVPLLLLTVASVVVEFACKPFRIPPPLNRRRAHFFAHTRCFDNGKARTELGFAPKIRPEEGLKEMVRSYREAGWID